MNAQFPHKPKTDLASYYLIMFIFITLEKNKLNLSEWEYYWRASVASRLPVSKETPTMPLLI